MAYSKTTWQNNVTDFDENNLNKMEQGIYDNSLVVDAVKDTINPTDTKTYKTAELTEGQITDVIGVSNILIKGQTSQDGTPTPSAPVDVNVVSGSNVINTSNKNLLDISKLITQTQNGLTITKNKDMSITLNGTSTSAMSIDVPIEIILKENITYTLSKNTIIGGALFALSFRDIDKNNVGLVSLDGGNKYINITLNTEQTAKYFRLYIASGITFANYTFYPMLEKSSTATTYEPHQGKEFPLDLGSIELCKIGNYQDYFYKNGSKWYLHKEINKIVANGSENWALSNGIYVLSRLSTNTHLANSTLISNLYEFITAAELQTKNYGIRAGNADFLQVKNVDITSLENFKTLLSTNNLIVYYILQTATDTEITNTTLISQLEAIYNAPLYEQTNITQENNDLPMVLDITACKDNINGIKAFIRK